MGGTFELAAIALLTACAPTRGASCPEPEFDSAPPKVIAEAPPKPVVPTPEDVCAQLRLLVDEPESLADFDRECVDQMRAQQRGYQKLTVCLAGAQEFADVDRCSGGAVSLDGGVSPERLCSHIIGLMKKELGEQADAIGVEELDDMQNKCVADAQRQREMKGAAEYRRQAACVLASHSLERLTRCDND